MKRQRARPTAGSAFKMVVAVNLRLIGGAPRAFHDLPDNAVSPGLCRGIGLLGRIL
jgi:hypothetical protein